MNRVQSTEVILGNESGLATNATDFTSLGSYDHGRLMSGTVVELPEHLNSSGIVSAFALAPGKPDNSGSDTQGTADEYTPC